MFDSLRPSAIGIVVASLALAGCGTESQEADTTPAPTVSASDAGVQAGPGLDSHMSGARSLGTVQCGGATLELSMSGDLAPKTEMHVDVVQTAGPPLAAIRLWIGDKSATGSLKSKGDFHDNRCHCHVEAPDLLSMDSALWIEGEAADGKRSTASVSLHEHR